MDQAWKATVAILVMAASVNGLPQKKQYTYIVSGRIVDNQGQPVPRAIVVLQPLPGENHGSLTEHYQANAQGLFHLNESSSLSTRDRVLYTTGPLPTDAYVPLTPPFAGLGTSDSSFAGYRIDIKQNGKTDLGDVLLQIQYCLVLIRFRHNIGIPLTDAAKATSIQGIRLRVRDIRGDVVSENRVPQEAFHPGKLGITIALPEGTWQLEMACEKDEDQWHPLSEPLTLHASQAPLEVTFKVPAGPEKTQPSDNYDPQLARQELERLGIDFTADAFIKRAMQNNTYALKLFLGAGLNPDVRDNHGSTALMTAASLSLIDVVALLLSSGADVNAADNQGSTALIRAAGSSNPAVVKMLMDKGADVNAKMKNGLTALIMAAANGTVDNLELLLLAGANVDARDKNGKTALLWANKLGRLETSELLRRFGAKN